MRCLCSPRRRRHEKGAIKIVAVLSDPDVGADPRTAVKLIPSWQIPGTTDPVEIAEAMEPVWLDALAKARDGDRDELVVRCATVTWRRRLFGGRWPTMLPMRRHLSEAAGPAKSPASALATWRTSYSARPRGEKEGVCGGCRIDFRVDDPARHRPAEVAEGVKTTGAFPPQDCVQR